MDSNQTTRYLKPADAAALLGMSPITLKKWRYRQYGPKWYRLGSVVRYIADEVSQWAKEQERQPYARTQQERKTGVAVRTEPPRVQRRHRLGGHRTQQDKMREAEEARLRGNGPAGS